MSSNSTFRILVSSDNHTGYAEDKPIIGNDSFDGFEEVLQHAKEQDVDFILLGGDLFHKSEPDRSTVHKVTELLRDYVLGDRDIPFEFMSEPGDVFGFSKFQRVNFEDSNLNIGMPIFTIHGNHDDFSGKGLLALDNFHDSGYLNLFGKFTDVEKIEVKPVLLCKGQTKIALYGIGHQRDDRLCRAFNLDKIKFFTLPEDFDDYFKILVVHQNRPPRSTLRSTGSYLPFEKIPKFFDLVVWGHEHACQVEDMEYERSGEPYILQPGSSVATSLCPDESIPKAAALLQIKKTSMKINKIPLERSRQVLFDVLDLNKKDPHVKLTKTQVRTKEMKDEKMIHEKIGNMLREAEKNRGDHQPDLPRIRLKVIYSGPWLNIPPVKPALIGEKYKSRVANPSELIKVHFVRPEKEKKNLGGGIELSNLMDTTTVFDLLRESIKQRAQNGLGLLQLDGMEELVKEQCSGVITKVGMKKDALRKVIDDQMENYMTRIKRLDMEKLGEHPPVSEIRGLVEYAVGEMIKGNQNQTENADVSSTSVNSNDENLVSDKSTSQTQRKRVPESSVVPDSLEVIDVDDDFSD
ncbi:hypothetical protein FO519_004810 [Halicephalobus sp. NKZ332]|nr:hypothetical protein FO519_004810 [Halicephalobus sp. NKZ332]